MHTRRFEVYIRRWSTQILRIGLCFFCLKLYLQFRLKTFYRSINSLLIQSFLKKDVDGSLANLRTSIEEANGIFHGLQDDFGVDTKDVWQACLQLHDLL